MRNFRFYEDIENHVKWLESNKQEGKQLVFENEDLSFISISDVNLNEAIFKSCNLQRAVFENVSLDMVYMFHNNFSYTNILNSTFKNSVLKNNIFEGTSFNNIQCLETAFRNNDFKGSTFEKIQFDSSYFELNEYKKSYFIDVEFTNSSIIKDKSDYCKYERILYSDSYFNLAQIKNSSFYDAILKKSYVRMEEENNTYFKTKPKQFFNNYKNAYPQVYTNMLFDSLYHKFEKFENLIINFKYTKDGDDDFASLYREFINNYISIDQMKYQLLVLETQDDNYAEQLTVMKNKIAELESIIKNRIDMLASLENRGEEDE